MAKYRELKNRYKALHRFGCGVTVSCMIVMVVVYTLVNFPHLSALWALVWTSTVTCALLVALRFIIKIWSVFEEVQYGLGKPKLKK